MFPKKAVKFVILNNYSYNQNGTLRVMKNNNKVFTRNPAQTRENYGFTKTS